MGIQRSSQMGRCLLKQKKELEPEVNAIMERGAGATGLRTYDNAASPGFAIRLAPGFNLCRCSLTCKTWVCRVCRVLSGRKEVSCVSAVHCKGKALTTCQWDLGQR